MIYVTFYVHMLTRFQSKILTIRIQYDLDSTCPDSTFYRLVRHFMLEQMDQLVKESDWIVHFIG